MTPFERSLAAQFWTNRLWTLVRQRKCLGATAVPDATCPFCRQAEETADHVANRCNLPRVISLIKRRHDEAILQILHAVLEGVHKDCTITCDARSVSEARRLTGVERGTKLPAWVLPHDQQHSYPDLCLINIKPVAGRTSRTPSSSQRRHSWIRIFEIKYAPDLEVHGRVRDEALAQHAALRDALLTAAWGAVTIHPVIIGNAGTITVDVLNSFMAMGINPTTRLRLGKRLAISSIKRTADIKRARLDHAAGPPTAVQEGSNAPRTDPAATADDGQAHRPPVPATADPPHPPSDTPSGETVPAAPVMAMRPVMATDAMPARDLEESPSSPPASEQWHLVTRNKRRVRSPPSCESPRYQETQALASRLPDRACKRARGFYAILAALSKDEDVAPLAVPVVQPGQKRCPHPDSPPAPPAAATTSPTSPASAAQPTTQWDEASVLPPLCSSARSVITSAAAGCHHDVTQQIRAVTASGQRQKRLKTVQVTTTVSEAQPDRPQSRRQSSPLSVERKSGSQSPLPARRSTLFPGANPALPLAAADRPHDMSPQTRAVTAPGRPQKKPKTVQVTANLSDAQPDGLQPRRLPSSVKRKPDSQSSLLSVRRSTRQRIASQAFDPSDPASVVGYVQARGTSPYAQSGLPFDPG